mgnify:CR=1 FL=1
MRKIFFIIASIATLVAPIVAIAIQEYEEGVTFSHYGSFDVIVRPEGWWNGQVDGAGQPLTVEGSSIEIECEPTVPEGWNGGLIPSVHPIGSPDDARALARILWEAADAAEAP